jgi:glycosyltransferase involved in cell wall biosynthesis
MRVCLLHNNYYRSSGSAIVIRRIFEAFSHKPVEFYFAGCGDAAWGDYQAEEDISWMPSERHIRFNLMCSGPKIVTEIAKFTQWLSEKQIDVIHAHHRRLAMLANLISTRTHIPVIYTGHNCFRWSTAFWLLAPRYATGVSSSVAKYLKKATRAGTVDVIWNPLTFPPLERPKAGQEADRATVISVGRLEPVKGHIHLIEAWRILKSNGFKTKLRIIGEGKLFDHLNAKIQADGLRELVSLSPYQSNIQDNMRASLFNVLASATEGFPNVVVEAAAVGCPSLVTNVDGSRDCVPVNAELPNLLPFGDPIALASALATWIANPSTVNADGLAFYSYLKDRCDSKRVCEAYHHAYERAIAGCTAGGSDL